MNIPDHPEIAMALATGYPHPVREHFIACCDCGAELSGADPVYDWDNDLVCESCCEKRIGENYFIKDIAEALGILCRDAVNCEEIE